MTKLRCLIERESVLNYILPLTLSWRTMYSICINYTIADACSSNTFFTKIKYNKLHVHSSSPCRSCLRSETLTICKCATDSNPGLSSWKAIMATVFPQHIYFGILWILWTIIITLVFKSNFRIAIQRFIVRKTSVRGLRYASTCSYSSSTESSSSK